ncbi:MAG: anthranilate phosphoribosyltransferase [Gammaproteobacteria bacterium]|nr:anthranilate phosphoribosyltransferase [Gammaproteobacteria bacterium]
MSKDILRSAIQKVATGPEYSKDIDINESYEAMLNILDKNVDPVQAAIYLIALRMKRETLDENTGSLKALLDKSIITTVDVDEIIDLAEPYNGFSRNTPVSPFLPAILASVGLATVTHGLTTVGPKFGLTHKKILEKVGVNVNKTPEDVSKDLCTPEISWAYIDQSKFCKSLHDLIDMRKRMVKRTVITTVEVLVGPIRGKNRTHLITGYVHPAYPPVYQHLANTSGFDTAILIKGVEGGLTPPLRQDAKIYICNSDNKQSEVIFNPKDIGIEQNTRAVPLPELSKNSDSLDEISSEINIEEFAEKASIIGYDALSGKDGVAKDSLIYASSIIYSTIKSVNFLDAAKIIRKAIDSGKAKEFFSNAI